MTLTSRDETDLILPLYAGMHEESRFSAFLETLRRRSQAEYVSLVLRHGDSPSNGTTTFLAGRKLRGLNREPGTGELHMLERIHYDRLRPGRVYSLAEFVDHDPVYKAEWTQHMLQLGIADERVVRVIDEDGISAWLIMARGKPCTAADSALLSSLAPYVAVALRSLVLIERQRIEAAMSTKGLARAGMGWIVFDSEARIVAIDPAAEQAFQALAIVSSKAGSRLRNIGGQAERELAAAAREFAENPLAAGRPIVLSEEPRVEALLMPTDVMPTAALAMPAMLALCRLPKRASSQRAANLAKLFDLPLREAQLAIGISDGLSLAEAGEALGLTLETTRNYSKRLYAKLGLRGQAELVRLVYESSASLG